MTTNTTAQIATFLNVSPNQIKSITEMAWVFCVVVRGCRARFVSKKVVKNKEAIMFESPKKDAVKSSFKTVQLKEDFQENPEQAMSVTLSKMSKLAPKWFLALSEDLQKQCYQDFRNNFEFADRIDRYTFMVPKTQLSREIVAKWVDQSKVYG